MRIGVNARGCAERTRAFEYSGYSGGQLPSLAGATLCECVMPFTMVGLHGTPLKARI